MKYLLSILTITLLMVVGSSLPTTILTDTQTNYVFAEPNTPEPEGISFDRIRESANNFTSEFSFDALVDKFRNMSIPVAITAVVIFGFLLFAGIWFKAIRKFTMLFLLGTILMFIMVNFTEPILTVLFAIAEKFVDFFTSFGGNDSNIGGS